MNEILGARQNPDSVEKSRTKVAEAIKTLTSQFESMGSEVGSVYTEAQKRLKELRELGNEIGTRNLDGEVYELERIIRVIEAYEPGFARIKGE